MTVRLKTSIQTSVFIEENVYDDLKIIARNMESQPVKYHWALGRSGRVSISKLINAAVEMFVDGHYELVDKNELARPKKPSAEQVHD